MNHRRLATRLVLVVFALLVLSLSLPLSVAAQPARKLPE
jgi:hypothetical protein